MTRRLNSPGLDAMRELPACSDPEHSHRTALDGAFDSSCDTCLALLCAWVEEQTIRRASQDVLKMKDWEAAGLWLVHGLPRLYAPPPPTQEGT